MQLRLLAGLCLLLLSCAYRAQSQSLCDSTGCVGDVKYSILPPGTFMQKYPGWIQLDGGADAESVALFNTSKLHLVLQVASLPDARGVFIRSMNMGRPLNTGDADGDGLPGRAQGDAFANHEHPVLLANNTAALVGWSNVGNGAPWRISSDDGPSWNNFSQTMKAAGVGGNETRPRNIALYVYIKIN